MHPGNNHQMLTTCIACGQAVSLEAGACPKCGQPRARTGMSTSKVILLVLAGILLIPVLFLILGFAVSALGH